MKHTKRPIIFQVQSTTNCVTPKTYPTSLNKGIIQDVSLISSKTIGICSIQEPPGGKIVQSRNFQKIYIFGVVQNLWKLTGRVGPSCIFDSKTNLDFFRRKLGLKNYLLLDKLEGFQKIATLAIQFVTFCKKAIAKYLWSFISLCVISDRGVLKFFSEIPNLRLSIKWSKVL